MTPLLLTLRFVLELCLLAAFAVVGWASFDSVVLQVTAAVLLPLAVALLWGMLLSPRRRLDLPLATRLIAELVLFAAAAIGLWSTGLAGIAIALAVAEIVVLGGLFLRGVPPGADLPRRSSD